MYAYVYIRIATFGQNMRDVFDWLKMEKIIKVTLVLLIIEFEICEIGVILREKARSWCGFWSAMSRF